VSAQKIKGQQKINVHNTYFLTYCYKIKQFMNVKLIIFVIIFWKNSAFKNNLVILIKKINP
jgi:hypothetical protein